MPTSNTLSQGRSRKHPVTANADKILQDKPLNDPRTNNPKIAAMSSDFSTAFLAAWQTSDRVAMRASVKKLIAAAADSGCAELIFVAKRDGSHVLYSSPAVITVLSPLPPGAVLEISRLLFANASFRSRPRFQANRNCSARIAVASKTTPEAEIYSAPNLNGERYCHLRFPSA